VDAGGTNSLLMPWASHRGEHVLGYFTFLRIHSSSNFIIPSLFFSKNISCPLPFWPARMQFTGPSAAASPGQGLGTGKDEISSWSRDAMALASRGPYDWLWPFQFGCRVPFSSPCSATDVPSCVIHPFAAQYP
jgi:hypothetical protein